MSDYSFGMAQKVKDAIMVLLRVHVVQSAFWKMVVHLWNLCLNSATIITCTLQTLINSFLLLAFFTDNKLRSNSNLFLLISLTFTDLLYSVTELPYVIYMLCGWAAEGDIYHYNVKTMTYLGSIPMVFMKADIVLTTFIAVSRALALFFPLTYFRSNKKRIFILMLILTTSIAMFDIIVCYSFKKSRESYDCFSFGCCIGKIYRIYRGATNLIFHLFTCFITIAVIICPRKTVKVGDQRAQVRRKTEEANFRELDFIIRFCTSLNILAHSFIFAIAHKDLRKRLTEIFNSKSTTKIIRSSILPTNNSKAHP
ncbi:unnamed protein product [Dracunculus medinensis]|uniref:G_PROTEIN_RECEP_F1_2 domain-containing protein n=1 Tax=Dracunculus medinensis TaxID=318479 RepID=A0A0N4UIR1_DRAME|nr:unnamed protein product [Dracunculus medinensis]